MEFFHNRLFISSFIGIINEELMIKVNLEIGFCRGIPLGS